MDERWIAFLYYFNIKKDYFECHEAGESLWLDTGRPEPLKGMIQAAVSLYHLTGGNIRGGYAMWLRGRQYLQPVLPVYLGVDVGDLIEQLDRVFQSVPAEWRNEVVHIDRIRELCLPDVTVKIVDGIVQAEVQQRFLMENPGD